MTAGKGANDAEGVTLSPCATVTVSTGGQLVAALEQLQPTSARLLVTLAANITLPADPTPQREDPAPDDSQPLIRVYRNVTLVGGAQGEAQPGSDGDLVSFVSSTASDSAVQLGLRMRRNAFGLAKSTKGQQQKQQQQNGQDGQSPSAGTFPYPVLVFSDLILVDTPPGPVSSWPVGLLGILQYYAGLDRSGASGVQLIASRTARVVTPGETGYLGYWYSRMGSLNVAERNSAAWLRQMAEPLVYVPSDGGGQTVRSAFKDPTTSKVWMHIYNTSLVPLQIPTEGGDFNLWSLEPPAPPAVALPPIPPPSFAAAMNASQLLALLQEAWTVAGPRVIHLVMNMSLRLEDGWPQAGANLSYNATLLGPVGGPPVWLDTGGLPLVTGMPGSSSPGVLNGPRGSGSVALQIHRVQLLGFQPPMLMVDPEQAAAAAIAPGSPLGSIGLQAWAERCSQQAPPQNGSTGSRPQIELRNCSQGFSTGVLDAVALSLSVTACSSGDFQPVAPGFSTPAWMPRLCSLLNGQHDDSTIAQGVLRTLLASAIAVTGQAVLTKNDTTGAPAPRRIFLSSASLSGVTFVNSTLYHVSSPANDVLTNSTDPDQPCGVEPLLLALTALPELSPSAASTASSSTLIGAAVGGAVGGAVLLGLAATLLLMRRRRHLSQQRDAKVAGSLADHASRVVIIKEDGATRGKSAQGEGTLKAKTPDPQCSRGPPDSGLEGTAAVGGPAAPLVTTQGADRGAEVTDDSFLAQLEDYGTGGLTFSDPPQQTEGVEYGGLDARARRSTMADAAFLIAGAGGSPAAGGAKNLPAALIMTPAQGGVQAPYHHAGLAETIEGDIVQMIRQCQLASDAVEAASGDSKVKAPRMQLLGRGAFGAVFLGEWRGLPAAIKVVMMGLTDAPTRRERLAREVALTMALSHPNIVPTYHHHINLLRVGGPGHTIVERWQGKAPTGPFGTVQHPFDEPPQQGGPSGVDDGQDVTGLELRLVMQYCEGGTLSSSLREGKFQKDWQDELSQSLRLSMIPSQALTTAQSTSAPLPPGHVAAAANDGTTTAVFAAVEGRDCGAEGAMPAAEQASSRPLPEPVQDRTPAGAERAMSWDDIKPAANMPLSVLAALDIARGLEYLHSRNVIHGDLTDNNVLLKAVVPVLPPPLLLPLAESQQQLGQASASASSAVCHTTAQKGGMEAAALPRGPTDRALVQPPGIVSPEGVVLVDDGTDVLTTGTAAAHSHAAQSVSLATSQAGTSASAWSGATEAAAVPAGPAMAPPTPTGPGELAAKRGDLRTLPRSGPAVSTFCAGLPALGLVGPSKESRPHVIAMARTNHMALSGASCSDIDGAARSRGSTGSASAWTAVRQVAQQLLRWTFKISDFGLAVQIQDPSMSHLSNMTQGTPYFVAPEVSYIGRLSPAADVYSFGILLWLLLHGVSLRQVRHMLPAVQQIPAGPLLLRHSSKDLPAAARNLMQQCLDMRPQQRPTASQLRIALEAVLKDVVGIELSQLLLGAERREHLVPEDASTAADSC